jgi:hypothetical protein
MSRYKTLLVVLGVTACALLAASASADAVKTGKFTGKTAQGYRVKLKVLSSHSLKVLNFTAKLKCRDGSTLIDSESGFQTTRIHNNSFNEKQFGGTDQVQIAGRARGGSVTGTLRVTDKLSGGVRCDSHSVKFTVRHS